jgi:plastocyanin
MNKKSSLITILLVVVLLLGILDFMLLQDLQNNSFKTTTNNIEPVKDLNNNHEIKIFEMTKHQERIFPNTINVDKGDKVVISFVASEPTQIVIDDFGVVENIQANNFEFVANKKGVFDYYCLDCDNKLGGVIIVN